MTSCLQIIFLTGKFSEHSIILDFLWKKFNISKTKWKLVYALKGYSSFFRLIENCCIYLQNQGISKSSPWSHGNGWAFAGDSSNFLKAAISSLNFWLGHYAWAVFRGSSCGFWRTKNLEQIVVFNQSNFVNVFSFCFSFFNSNRNLKFRLTNRQDSDLKSGYSGFCRSATLNNKIALTLSNVWGIFGSQFLFTCIFRVSRGIPKLRKIKKMLHSEITSLGDFLRSLIKAKKVSFLFLGLERM